LGSQSSTSIAKDMEENLAVAFAIVVFSPCGDNDIDSGSELEFVGCCGMVFALCRRGQ